MREASYREAFELPEGEAYLNCAYLAPQLAVVREAASEALALRATPWRITPGTFFAQAERARELFARLVSGNPEGVALIGAASYGIAVAAGNAEVRPGERVVVLEEQFPSNYYPWLDLVRRREATLHVVGRPEDGDWTEAILGALTPDTAVVAVPNCHWTDGSLVDLVRVGTRAREVGALFVVDATQSLGAMPLDVSEVEPDFLVAAGYKWLLGPYGNGFMYVGERYREGRPLEGNWISRSGSEDFSRLTDYTDEFQPGARRFDAGGRGASVLLPMGNAALEWILSEGVKNIASGIENLTDLVAQRAEQRGFGVAPKRLRARHMLGLKLGLAPPEDLVRRLAEERVYVSVRGSSIRVSPHLYNDERDVERLFTALDGVLPGD